MGLAMALCRWGSWRFQVIAPSIRPWSSTDHRVHPVAPGCLQQHEPRAMARSGEDGSCHRVRTRQKATAKTTYKCWYKNIIKYALLIKKTERRRTLIESDCWLQKLFYVECDVYELFTILQSEQALRKGARIDSAMHWHFAQQETRLISPQQRRTLSGNLTGTTPGTSTLHRTYPELAQNSPRHRPEALDWLRPHSILLLPNKTVGENVSILDWFAQGSSTSSS